MTKERLNQIVDSAFNCAFRVHTALGPGLLESSYKACMAFELAKAGLAAQMEVPVPLVYEGQSSPMWVIVLTSSWKTNSLLRLNQWTQSFRSTRHSCFPISDSRISV